MNHASQMVSVPSELLEQALDAAAAVGMQDVADELDRILTPTPNQPHEVAATPVDIIRFVSNDQGMEEHDLGEWVAYGAHAEAIERLREENLQHRNLQIEADDLIKALRAQLAERDALLRDFLEVATGGFSDSDHVLRVRRHLESFLSASTEPSMPQYHRQPLGMDEAVRARLTLIAREAAISSAHRYNYMPTTPEGAQGWQPHAWVLEALRMVELGTSVQRDEHEAFSQACRDAALAKGHQLDPQALDRRPNGSHTNELVECGWWGWQARAALERNP